MQSMLTCIHLQKCYTSECYAPLCHNISGTLTHMPMLNVTTSTNVPPKVQSTMTSESCCKKPPFFAGQTISVLNDARNLWLPATIIHKANNGSYLVQVIGGGQYRCAHDHIQECHLDAVKPDTSNIGNVAPAASTSAPATQAVRLPTAVTPTTPTPAAPAATLQTPCKALPAVCSP